MASRSLNTPCVGLCSTVYGDAVCRGCKRYDYEIIDWNTYTSTQHEAVWQRLEQLLEEVMANKLAITDRKLLEQKLIKHSIRFRPQQSSYYWAYLLLTKGARLINNIEAYGIHISVPYDNQPLWELREQIDVEFFALSEKNYPTTLP
ncbi:DUF1289 domain-containing protein [Gammaproteobacteria bacterium ESL0073]|uniref:DUF1289 domain-containing protein n=1 Tax=Entomomonas moraniae TaxID=2213226 RepID=A0A3S9XFD4_9GAMM|nr:DUF1289 domain-containing protein [Entomomonas moraniae]AWM79218.1 DUF1289 domain-containing protein [Gammaproteobacteria bacterium ESL0073]AZS51143.1 DUF1289 domain-containing protein [Entomomonas moraniae]